jgi:hypothetical protein
VEDALVQMSRKLLRMPRTDVHSNFDRCTRQIIGRWAAVA